MPPKHKTPIPSDESSTRTIIKDALSQMNNNKEYEPTDTKQTWFDAQLLKIVMSLVVFLCPLVAGFFVFQANLDKRIALLEDQKQQMAEMKADVKEIKNDILSIKLMLAKDGKIAWVPNELEGNNTP